MVNFDDVVNIAFTGETNLDEINDSIRKSVNKNAKSAELLADTMEHTDSATENLAKAMGELRAGLESAEDGSEEVEDELEDITTDAGAATTSIYALQSSLHGLDGTNVDLDTDVDDLDEQYKAVRNTIDDFDHRFDEVIPQRPAGQAIKYREQETAQIEELTQRLLDASYAVRDYKEERDAAFGEDAPEITDPFAGRRRSITPDIMQSSDFRSSLAEQLQFQRESQTNRATLGNVLSGVDADDLNVEQLARKLSNLNFVSSDLGETMDALNTSIDETITPLDEILDDVEKAQGQPGINRRFFKPVPTPSGDRDVAPSVPTAFPSKQGIEVPTGPIDAPLRQQLADLGEITEEQARKGIDTDTIRISEETDRALGSESVRKGLDASSLGDDNRIIGNREFKSLSDSLDEAAESFSKSATEIGQATEHMGRGEGTGFIGDFTKDTERIGISRVAESRRGNRISGLKEAFSELKQASLQTTTTLGFVTAGMTALTASSKNADMAVDDLDDEVGDLARSLSALAPALKTVSANLGPFNIGLTNLAITIPALIATVGPLITLFLGLASAAVAVAGAFGAIVAVGAMGFLQDLEDQFAGINNTMEAIEATAKGFKQAIIDAIEPLQGVTIGGLDATGIFVTVLRDVVQLVHMFAEATAELLEMQVVEDFLLNLRAAVLGFSDATGGLTMIEGLKELMRGALPVLEDFFIWFIDKLPDAMAFFGQITAELGQPISEVGSALLNLVTVVTTVGTGIANQLLTPLALTINFFTSLIGIALGIYDAFGSVADIVAATTIAFATLTLTVVKSIQVFEFGVELHRLVTNTIEKMNDAVENADNAYDAYRQAVNKTNSSLITYTSIAATAIVVTSLFVVGIYLILSGLGLLEPVAKLANNAIGFLKENVFGAARAFERATGGIIPLTEMLEVAAGVLALYTAFQIAAAGSTVAGTKAMYSQLVPLGALIKSKLAYLGAVTLSTLANYGFISSAVAMEVQIGTLTGAINAANVSLTLFQVLTGIAIVTAIAILISELTGLTNAFTDVDTAVFGLLTALGTLAAVAKYAGYSFTALAGSTMAFNAVISSGILGALGLIVLNLALLNDIAGPVITGITALTATFLAAAAGAKVFALGLGAVKIALAATSVASGVVLLATLFAVLVTELARSTDYLGITESAILVTAAALGVIAPMAKYAGYSFTALAGSITAVNVALSAGILAGLAFIVVGLQMINNYVGPVAAGITALAAALLAATAGTIALALGFSALSAALISTGVGAIVVAIGLAIGLLIVALRKLYNNWDEVSSKIKKGLGLLPVVQQFQTLLKVIRIVWDYLSDIDGSTISFDVVGSIFPGIPDTINPLSGRDVANNRAAPGARTRNTESRTENNIEINVDNRGSGELGDRVINKIKRAATDAIVENDMREQGR